MNKPATRKPKNNKKKIQHADSIQYYVPRSKVFSPVFINRNTENITFQLKTAFHIQWLKVHLSTAHV